MPLPEFNKLSALVVDDFTSFRSTLSSMLNKLGLTRIDEAVNVAQALKASNQNTYDFILCDYNLGPRRTGQHLLEELRHKGLITFRTLFIMITAESGKEMVLAAYDHCPDDYLVKPLNLRVLQQRLTRLLGQREALAEAQLALSKNNLDVAIEVLEGLAKTEGRYRLPAQKLLGETYLKHAWYDEASALYKQLLADKELDWAKLGSIRALYALNHKGEAIDQLLALTRQSRMFLPAYDELANIHEKESQFEKSQAILEEAVGISPKSILRQRRLSEVAIKTGDVMAVMKASSAASHLGEMSCHGDVEDSIRYLRAMTTAVRQELVDNSDKLLGDGEQMLSNLDQEPGLSIKQGVLSALLNAKHLALKGYLDRADKIYEQEQKLIAEQAKPDLEILLAQFDYLHTLERTALADAFAIENLSNFDAEDDRLRIDALSPQPAMMVNQKRLSKLNRQGIDSYTEGKYDASLSCFQKACSIFPRHRSLHLNRLQSLIGCLRVNSGNPALRRRTQAAIDLIDKLITEDHEQYARFMQLRTLASGLLHRN